MGSVNDYVLFLRFHLLIAWETQPTSEKICSSVDSRLFDLGLCMPASVSLENCDISLDCKKVMNLLVKYFYFMFSYHGDVSSPNF